MVVQQELMWRLKPDLVIETGIAHGGSIIFSASMMEMMGIEGEVVGVDIDIRPHNRNEIENHPMMKRITMIEGSSTDAGDLRTGEGEVRRQEKCVMVVLDSLHSHQHVYDELQLYP
jgi:cephalosporin hydroxylase